jgi:hypothetical protein
MSTARSSAGAGIIAVGLACLSLACGGEREEPPGERAPAPRAAAPAAPTVDACALVTRAEVEAVLGTPVRDPARGDVAPVFSCSYSAASGFDTASLTVAAYGDTRQATDAYLLALKINDYKEVSGLGDRAYTSPLSEITVLKGRYELSVDLSMSIDKDAQMKKAIELANRALARLPQ